MDGLASDGAEVLACHRRSYDKGARIEDTAHIQALVEQKRAARHHRAHGPHRAGGSCQQPAPQRSLATMHVSTFLDHGLVTFNGCMHF